MRFEPDPVWHVIVTDDGHIECSTDDPQLQLAFDQWRLEDACQHKDCVLLHHYIGNITLIERLRASLSDSSTVLPIIFGKVLHNATHCGDWLDLPTVRYLESELNELALIHCQEPQDEDRLRFFESQMQELVEAALEVGKPIFF